MATLPLRTITFPDLDNVYTVTQKDNLLLYTDVIDDTTQSYTFSGGTVSKIEHSLKDGAVIRTDTFTYGEDTITETRTLNTGERLSIATNLTTLATTVTYTKA